MNRPYSRGFLCLFLLSRCTALALPLLLYCDCQLACSSRSSLMRSSALLDAFGGAICAAIAFPAGWWWCGVLSIVIMLINLGVKAHEVSVSSSIARSVATHVPQLEQQRTEAKKNAWSGRKLLVLVNPNAGSNHSNSLIRPSIYQQ